MSSEPLGAEIVEGSLYSGYGGLGAALRMASALPVRTAWHCDPDPDCDATLAKHHPGVPNLDSDTAPDWSRVQRPDVLTLGPPCQPVSAAGRGAGVDDPRWRWPYAYVALHELRSPVLFFENVANLAAGKQLPLWHGILADMRAAGYQVAWVIIGACMVGAPHHRHRLFAVGRLRDDAGPAVRLGERAFCGTRMPLLPSPVARDGDPAQRGEGSPEYWARRQLERPTEGIPLGAAVRLLPAGSWGEYAPAVARWEAIFGRPAPDPVEPTARGGGFRLAPALPEWMMGLPAGHLTGHLGRPAALRLAGNGVCPQQAAEAFRLLWPLV